MEKLYTIVNGFKTNNVDKIRKNNLICTDSIKNMAHAKKVTVHKAEKQYDMLDKFVHRKEYRAERQRNERLKARELKKLIKLKQKTKKYENTKI